MAAIVKFAINEKLKKIKEIRRFDVSPFPYYFFQPKSVKHSKTSFLKVEI